VVVLQFAIRRVSVLRMSGATDVILKLKDDAVDSDFPPSHVYVVSPDFVNILSPTIYQLGHKPLRPCLRNRYHIMVPITYREL